MEIPPPKKNAYITFLHQEEKIWKGEIWTEVKPQAQKDFPFTIEKQTD